MTTYTVAHQAYVKIALHAAKYPYKQVNGLLLGKTTDSSSVEILDSIPLLHHWTNLSPSMEIGFYLTASYSTSVGLELIGYYQVSEYPNDVTLSPVGEKIVERIKQYNPNGLGFVVDSTKLASGEPALIPYAFQGGSTSLRPVVRSGEPQPFSPLSMFRLKSPSSPIRALQLIRESMLHLKLGDFDDHLEDVSVDWLRNSSCNDQT